jgi:hypothetical protein
VTSLFSSPEDQSRRSDASSPPPMTNPFQAPDFEEDGSGPPEGAQESVSGEGAAPGPPPAFR